MQVIAIANHKGGCAKTTTAINLAYSLTEEGKQVLLVDLDPQAHATLGLNLDPDKQDKTLYDLLKPGSKVSAKSTILSVYPGLDLIPGCMQSAYLEQLLAGEKDREKQLSKLFKKLNYDYIILDTAPTLGLLTINALLAANKVIVPVEPSSFALHGLQKLEETLAILASETGHTAKVRYLLTLFNYSSKFCMDFLHTLTPFFTNRLCTTRIMYSEEYKNACALGLPIQRHVPHSAEAACYTNLAREISVWDTTLSPVYIRPLPENAKIGVLPLAKKAKADYCELIRKTEKNTTYKYVIDHNGNISSVKVDQFTVPVAPLH